MAQKQRKEGTGSIYKTEAGWMAQVRYADDDGKRRLARRRAASRDEARAALKELLGASPRERQTKRKAGALTVAEFVTTWAEVTLPTLGRSEGTVRTYREVVKAPLVPTLGSVRLANLTPTECEKWLRRLDQATKRDGQPISQATKRLAHAVLRSALEAAVRDGLLQSNPLSVVPSPRRQRTVVPVALADDTDAALRAVEGRRVAPVVVFVAYTGCRISEALSVRWADVDLEQQEALLRGTKTDSAVRSVPLMPEVVEALREVRARQRHERLMMGAGWADQAGLVFTTGTGSPYSDHQARRDFTAALRAAGLPTARPFHSLRHGLATRLLNRGVPMPMVSKILGHASIRTTVDTYAHVELAMTASAMAEALSR